MPNAEHPEIFLVVISIGYVLLNLIAPCFLALAWPLQTRENKRFENPSNDD